MSAPLALRAHAAACRTSAAARAPDAAPLAQPQRVTAPRKRRFRHAATAAAAAAAAPLATTAPRPSRRELLAGALRFGAAGVSLMASVDDVADVAALPHSLSSAAQAALPQSPRAAGTLERSAAREFELHMPLPLKPISPHVSITDGTLAPALPAQDTPAQVRDISMGPERRSRFLARPRMLPAARAAPASMPHPLQAQSMLTRPLLPPTHSCCRHLPPQQMLSSVRPPTRGDCWCAALPSMPAPSRRCCSRRGQMPFSCSWLTWLPTWVLSACCPRCTLERCQWVWPSGVPRPGAASIRRQARRSSQPWRWPEASLFHSERNAVHFYCNLYTASRAH